MKPDCGDIDIIQPGQDDLVYKGGKAGVGQASLVLTRSSLPRPR